MYNIASLKNQRELINGFKHPRLGDLSRLSAVSMDGISPHVMYQPLDENAGAIIHLTITGRCYAHCRGCINSMINRNCEANRSLNIPLQESDPQRDSLILKQLIDSISEKAVTICFYGGEPFLAPDRMHRIVYNLKALSEKQRLNFLAYTNGELLIEADQRYPALIDAIWLFSVSIDGDEEQHNRVRPGTSLAKITKNLEYLKSRKSHNGQVLFWSTLREEQSLLRCFRQFKEMYDRKLVHHFFWHWAETRECFTDFTSFARRYGSDLEQIMLEYTAALESGIVLPIAHINELIIYLLTGKQRGHTACAVELAGNYDIVDGSVHACADLPADIAMLGGLDGSGRLALKESNLSALLEYKEALGCLECGVHAYCGGRCPVQAVIGSPERTLQYCQLMRLHTGTVKEFIPAISFAMKKNNIDPQYLFNRSACIAGYTDVVP